MYACSLPHIHTLSLTHTHSLCVHVHLRGSLMDGAGEAAVQLGAARPAAADGASCVGTLAVPILPRARPGRRPNKHTHTHTRTHIHTHTLTLTHTYTHTLSLSVSLYPCVCGGGGGWVGGSHASACKGRPCAAQPTRSAGAPPRAPHSQVQNAHTHTHTHTHPTEMQIERPT
jgi:hypothetical protein